MGCFVGDDDIDSENPRRDSVLLILYVSTSRLYPDAAAFFPTLALSYNLMFAFEALKAWFKLC